MLKYITEAEYKELLGKTSIPDNFNNLVIEASAYINRKTHGRIDIDDIQEEVKYTTCVCVDLINERDLKINNIGNLKSENIEGWSVNYQTNIELKKEYEDKMYSVLCDYLWNVIGSDNKPLLYGGVCLYE